MKSAKQVDLVVIGGGPAGLTAALTAHSAGCSVLLVERAPYLGGVLRQCIHTGFGHRRYGLDLTGPEYAESLIREVSAAGIPCCTEHSVIHLGDKVLRAACPDGLREIHAGAVILATGCRERALGALPVTGPRPTGVITAGSAQKMINCRGWQVGEKIVVLGSGDIGLIMARRLHLEGKEVITVLEQADHCGGLLRNRVQCLDDFAIPLQTRSTVSHLYGAGRLSGVRVSGPAGEYDIACDTLLVAAGLIPETDLLCDLPTQNSAGPSDPAQTPWLFLAGNAREVQSLVDDAAADGESAARSALHYLKSGVRADSGFQTENKMGGQLRPDQMICLRCPQQCVLTIVADQITGGACAEGAVFAREELLSPRRVLTTTLAAAQGRLPVKSDQSLPLPRFAECLRELRGLRITMPIRAGAVCVPNICHTGVNIVATMTLE